MRLPNPCDEEWAAENGFGLDDLPPDLRLERTELPSEEIEWSICAMNLPVQEFQTNFSYVGDRVRGFPVGSNVLTISAAPALTASFTFARGPLDPVARTVRWTFTASAGPGQINRYSWHLVGNDGTVVDADSDQPVLELDLSESTQKGRMTLTVTAALGGATATVQNVFR